MLAPKDVSEDKKLFVGPQPDGIEAMELDKDDRGRVSQNDLSMKQVWQRVWGGRNSI